MRTALTAASLLITVTLSAQSGIEQRVEAAVQKVKEDVPGLSIAVSIDGKTVYAKGFGTTSASEIKPPTADTQYRLASVSKVITAVAVLKLVEQGRVGLDRPARDYCTALAPLNAAPTVRHFLLHQSGMRHTSDNEDESIKGEFPRLSPALAGVVKEPLRFAPGSRTLYTSWGYAALGCVIESVSEQSYADFIKERIFAPAQMQHSTFDSPTFTSPTFSPGFVLLNRRPQPSVVVDTRFKMPSSGIISTVNDLTRFASALFDKRLLPAAMFREMTSTRAAPGDERPTFTAGWTIGPTNLETPGFNYNGSMEGTTAVLVILPERRISVALLANRERFVPGVMPIVREALGAALRLAAGLPNSVR
jgi:CubicO group peptidase (beta-lactamase class C family)